MHDAHFWGWEIPVYLFLGGMAAGLMILSAAAPARSSRAMRLLPFAAPVVLSFGMFALFLDLENKWNVIQFYTSFRVTSPMSWGAWILLAIYPASILLGIARNDIAQVPAAVAAFARARMTGLRRLNVALGVALGAYTGVLLGTLGARALWASLLLAPLFLVSGFSTAAAVTMLLPIDPEEHDTVRRWDMFAIGAEIVLLAMFFVDVATAGMSGRQAVSLFFGGPYTATFWALVVILGLAAPLALEITESKRHLRPAAIAPLFLLTGGLALRWIFVAAGQAL